MKTKYLIHTLIFTSLLQGCGRSLKTNELHNQNLKSYDKFTEYTPVKQNIKPVNQVMKFTGPKKDLKVNGIGLGGLANLLTKTYKVNVSSTNHNDELTISCDYKNVNLEYILNDLVDKYNVGFEKVGTGYSIYPPQVKSKIFHLHYHNFKRSGSSSISTNGSGGNSSGGSGGDSGGSSSSSIQTSVENSFWANIMEAINVIIQDDKNVEDAQVFGSGYNNSSMKSGAISIDKDNGIIIVRAYPRALKMVETFINKVKKNCLKQVVIEAKILEIELKDEFDFGVDWSLLKSETGNGIKFDPSVNAIGDGTAVPGLFSTNLSLGSDVIFKSAIKMLSNQGTVSVLSSPKISVINNQKAIIKYGDNVSFVSNASDNSTTTGTTTKTSSGFGTQSYFSGIALDATPTITEDLDIIIHLHPVVSRVEQDKKSFKLNDKVNEVSFPKISNRETDTIVKAKSGDVVVIGGLSQSNTSMKQSGPGGRNYIVGALGRQIKSSRRTELIILLRPIIVESFDDFDKVNTKDYVVQESLSGF